MSILSFSFRFTSILLFFIVLRPGVTRVLQQEEEKTDCQSLEVPGKESDQGHRFLGLVFFFISHLKIFI